MLRTLKLLDFSTKMNASVQPVKLLWNLSISRRSRHWAATTCAVSQASNISQTAISMRTTSTFKHHRMPSLEGTYADRTYWDQRYAERSAPEFHGDDGAETHFDWLCEYPSIKWWICKYLPVSGVALDIGCGNSALALHLAQHHKRIELICMDFSHTAAIIMQQISKGLQFIVADACRTPMKSNSIDIVVDKGCLDSILNEYDQVHQQEKWGKLVSEDRKKTKELHLDLGLTYLREMCRVLVPGGHLLVCSYEPPQGRLHLLLELEKDWHVHDSGIEDESGNYLYSCCKKIGK